MEIERKWMVQNWPEKTMQLPLIREEAMRQGYINVSPTVRIREEAVSGGSTDYILCFKSASTSNGLSRQEIEFPITPEQFSQLEGLIGIPLIPKTRRVYLLPDGLHLEVNLVDEGMDTEFVYAEIEYETEEQAKAWTPSSGALSDYLHDEVTGIPTRTMGAHWVQTRLRQKP